jgi:hypothetical protein
MFGIPGEVFWPTAAISAIVAVVFSGMALLRFLPHARSRDPGPAERDTLEELRHRLDQVDQLQQRVGELEERVDFTERLLAQQHESERLASPSDEATTREPLRRTPA